MYAAGLREHATSASKRTNVTKTGKLVSSLILLETKQLISALICAKL